MPIRLSLELDSPTSKHTFRAGAEIKGSVVVRADEAYLCSGLHVFHAWRAKGAEETFEGNKTRRVLFAGHWTAGQRAVYSFTLLLPHWPVSHDGELIAVQHVIGTELKRGFLDLPTIEERPITVFAGPGTFRHMANLAPTHSGATDTMGGGLCCSTIALGLGGALLSAASTAPLEDAVKFGIIGGFIVFAACIGAVASVRNFVAERRIGEVFVGLKPSVHAGRELGLLVRFQPGASVRINEVTASLTCVELASRGAGKESQTQTHTAFHQTIVLSGPRTVAARTALEEESAFHLPESAAPSFEVTNNTIKWQLELRVDIDDWPDWVHTYPIQVTPPGLFTLRAKTKLSISMRVQQDQVCPYCRDAVADDDASELTTCAGCGTVLHKECMRELGRCSTRGCRRSGLRA